MKSADTTTFSIITFGCKVNQYESQLIREELLGAGYREDGENPGLIIINTCAVTGRTEAKVRKKIRSRLRNHPGSRLILTGCGVSYSQLAGENIIHSIPPERRGQFPPAVRKRSGEGISFFEGHHRAFLKIQDGCDSYCSYCIIPYLRGKSRSRPRSSIIEEIWRLRQRGYREIVLTGIHLGKYGEDFNPPSSLQELAGALPEGEEGCFRYRLSSIEPGEITDDLLEMIYKEKHFCPHLHIPLQSGSDRILRLMNRDYTYRRYRRITEDIRSIRPDICFSTDCLIGFPGETEDDFLLTCRAIEEIGFNRVHVFPYSRRAMTRAAGLPELSPETIKARLKVIGAVSDRSIRSVRREMISRTVEVLIEKADSSGGSGVDEYYNRVAVPSAGLEPGELYRAKVISAGRDGCVGELIG